MPIGGGGGGGGGGCAGGGMGGRSGGVGGGAVGGMGAIGGVGGLGGAVSGCTHDARSKSMNSSTFSCGVRGLSLHSAGKTTFWVVAASLTWKSLNSTRPHCCAPGVPTGVLKVKCCTVAGVVE